MQMHYHISISIFCLFFRRFNMSKTLSAISTLTDRYQTTIPEPVRELLHLSKRDKINYTVEENGKIIISRANEEDPLLGDFLNFLANDIKDNFSSIQPISSALIDRARHLTTGMDIDLDISLDDKDE